MEENSDKKVGQEQIHSLLFGDKISWQSIIFELINTEQLDPWDINISLLAEKFLEKIRLLEEANFFVSSKVLLAAALLLRLKSELILERDIEGLDAKIYGEKKEEKPHIQEKIELNEEIPPLIPRTPLPRFKKVTLPELLAALNKAINTENRRIRRITIAQQRELEATIGLPETRINLNERIREVFSLIKKKSKEKEDRISFNEILPKNPSREEKIESFIPLLHLDSQLKIWIEQEKHLDEIWILLKHVYEKKNKEELEKLAKEIEQELIKESEDEKSELIEEEFEEEIEEN